MHAAVIAARDGLSSGQEFAELGEQYVCGHTARVQRHSCQRLDLKILPRRSQTFNLHVPPQLDEEIQPDCKWSLLVKNVLHSGKSEFQSVELVETDTYGKVSSLALAC